ncbi:MAG TPA: type II toxin-antitoxin system CcdA family antitoxin [Stellaceae bacterium]|nr:type II toxin-antitoxin system CcdA family antitoxin [Stellaceae bacterium]
MSDPPVTRLDLMIAARESAPRRATNVTLNASLLDEARELGINISRACERGIAMQVAMERAARWRVENKEAIEASNAYVERHGLPLARFRQF